MSKRSFCLFVLGLNLCIISAQSTDPVILSYQRNFIRASISTKLELLNDASRINTINMTPLYIDALSFVNSYYPVLGTDSQLMDLAVIAITKVTAYKDPSVLPVLRLVFTNIPDTKIRIAALNTYAQLVKDQKNEIDFLNDWFAQSNADVKTLTAGASTLGKIGDSSSFTVLFKAATSSLDSSIIQAATQALNLINANYTENILAIIAEKHVKEAYAAFSFAMKKENLAPSDKGRIAEAAFALVLDMQLTVPDTTNSVQSALLRESMDKLTSLSWTTASPLVVKYFYQKQGDYKNEKANIDLLVPVIRCMGAMATTESAQALSIFLGLLNSDTEQKKTYNEQLLLVVIQALGDLGDKSAFDYLLYVGYLDYPETVKKASRDALARLQW